MSKQKELQVGDILEYEKSKLDVTVFVQSKVVAIKGNKVELENGDVFYTFSLDSLKRD